MKTAKWWLGGFILILGLVSVNAQQENPKGTLKITSPWYQENPVNMGPSINTDAREAEATFTANGETMYYNCSHWVGTKLDNDICVSYFEDGEWTQGEVVEYPISTPATEVEPYISLDGNKLQFMSNRSGGKGLQDIWISEKVDGVWQEPENLGEPINSRFMDHCLYYSGPDENTGYLTRMDDTDDPDRQGNNDIYVVHRVNGVWQKPVNLGPNVNSPYSDHHGMVSPDGKSIYFNSDRPRTDEQKRIGKAVDEDIYVSTMDAKGVFGPAVPVTPLNIDGYHDRCVMFTTDHRVVLFDSERPGGYGNKDLYWMYYENIKHIK